MPHGAPGIIPGAGSVKRSTPSSGPHPTASLHQREGWEVALLNLWGSPSCSSTDLRLPEGQAELETADRKELGGVAASGRWVLGMLLWMTSIH